jgi:hypothetical protein
MKNGLELAEIHRNKQMPPLPAMTSDLAFSSLAGESIKKVPKSNHHPVFLLL